MEARDRMQHAGLRQSRWGWLLPVLIAVRTGCAAVVFFGLIKGLRPLATCAFALACVTDLLDGQIATRTNSSPSLGGYADPAADFVLILGAFFAFMLDGVYPVWTVAVIVLMFLQFVLTSGRQGPRYDPVGKYYGAALFGAVGITLVSSNPLVHRGVLLGVVLCTGASVASRYIHLVRGRKAVRPHR